MKIRELIEELLKSNSLEDEIIATYWDKNYFLENSDLTLDQVDTVWTEFVKEGQETLEGHLEFTQTGHDFLEDLEEMIEDSGDKNE